MSDTGTLVYVVDDDISAREGVARLICSAGLTAKTFASGEEFLAATRSKIPGCLILDVQLPGMSGIELLHHMNNHEYKVPVIFITAHVSDEQARSEAASDWTVAYLIKPFSGEELLDAVNAALKWKACNYNETLEN